MDWLKIINSHVMWKQRLLEHMDGASQQKLDPAVVRRDDLCELGKWLHNDGKAYAETDHFPVVKDNHAHFHDFAARIVELIDAGNLDAAKDLLNGEYAKISRQLQLRLSSMAQEGGESPA
jgi:hypothetical protein